MHLKKIVITSSLLLSTLFAGTYNVDKSHSNIGFEVKPGFCNRILYI